MVSHPPWPQWSIVVAAGLLGYTAGSLLTGRHLRQRLAVTRDLAEHDPLTGLPNRRALLTEVTARLDRRQPTVLALIDLDDFKTVNDTFGHLVGDDLLVAVAHRLHAAATHGGYAARLGGDEFVLLLPARGGSDPAVTVAAVLTHLAEPIHLGAATLRPQASAGVATTGHTRCTWRDLITRADHALYRAKTSGTRVAVHRGHQPPAPRQRDRH